MAKYRKKPVVIDAIQITAEWFDNNVSVQMNPKGLITDSVARKVYIHTLEGRMVADEGDWIITGIKGERYPCKPDIFAATYEPVD
jgi:hypothetical protein